jgi:homospermidine synthase
VEEKLWAIEQTWYSFSFDFDHQNQEKKYSNLREIVKRKRMNL